MSDADLFTDAPAPAGGDLFTDEPAPRSFLSKTASNVVPDIKNIGAGLKDFVSGPALDIASGDIASATPKLAKQAEDFWKNPKENAAAMARPVTHPVDYFEEHPVQQTLNALGALEVGKGLMGNAAEGAAADVPRGTTPQKPPEVVPMPPEAPKGLPIMDPGAKTGDPHALFAYNDKFGPGGTERSIYNVFGDPNHPALKARGWGSSVPAEELEKAGIPITGREPKSTAYEPLPNVPKQPPATPPAAATPGVDSMANDAMSKAKEVKDYISKGYEGYAKKPGAASQIADYVQEKSQMMAAQQMGATPLQARQIGHEGMRAIGQYALDNDIVSPTTGLKGMRAKTTALNEAAGKTIGDVRDLADSQRVPAENSIDVLQQVKQKYDPLFSRGTRSGEAGAYGKVLEEIEDAPPTFKGMAELSTKLNKAANEANRLNQPHGVYTDIANEISHINNERIKTIVGPEKAAKYEQALRDFGATKKISEFLKRKEAGEVKRIGPGSLTSNLTQKAMDEFGYRAGAKVANKVSSAIKRNPAISKSVPSLFKEFINQVEDVGHEVTGMAKGGIVPDDVKRYVSSKC